MIRILLAFLALGIAAGLIIALTPNHPDIPTAPALTPVQTSPYGDRD